MPSRRGLMAAFLLSVLPFQVEAKRRHKKHKKHKPVPPPTNPTYFAVIHDNQIKAEFRDDASAVVSAYAEALGPYGVSVVYQDGNHVICTTDPSMDDVAICNTPQDNGGASGSGWGRWKGVTLNGGVNIYPYLYNGPTVQDGRRFVLCHELGHVFGLSHVPVGTDSCMQQHEAGVIGDWVKITFPSPSDIANIVALLPNPGGPK